MDAQIAKLKEWVDASDNIVFFGGAGVSTESGIPDFRSVDGLYNQQYKYPPETILSHSFFISEPEEFYRFYRAKMLALDAKPNAAHLKLAEWERMGKCRAVVTQNIDGLHQKAGSKEVLELHGSVLRNYCIAATSHMTCAISPQAPVFRNAAAAARSSRMLCCTRKVWTATPLTKAWITFAKRISLSSAALRLPCIRLRA